MDENDVINRRYNALVIIDQGIPYQRPSTRRVSSIILIRAPPNQLEDLLPLVPAILQALETIGPRQIPRIPPSL